MMAPSPAGGDAGGDQSDQGNGDACDAHQQLDPPSKRRRLEELGEYYRHKRQKIQEQQNGMSALGYSTNHDYGGLAEEPESQMLSEPQVHHQPGESSSVRSSPIDAYPPEDGEESGTVSSRSLAGDRQPLPLPSGGSVALRKARSQPSHREAKHNMQWDQGDAEPANQTPSEAGSRGCSPPAAISSRGSGDEYAEYGDDNISLGGDEDRQSALHREAGHGRHRYQDRAESVNDMPFVAHPSPTLRMRGDIARDRARPAGSTMTIQPEQPARLDAYPPEDSEESGTDNTSLAGDEDRQSLPPVSGSNIAYRQARSQDHAKRRKIQEAEHDIHRDIPSETESGGQPHSQPQQATENTTRSWVSVVLSSSTTITSDHSLQPLADSGHTHEPSRARSPLQASPTASPYSTNEFPRHRSLLTAGDGIVRLASELDYSEASATVQHSGHPVAALSAVAQSTEGEAGLRAAKPDSSGRSTQAIDPQYRFKPRKPIQLATPIVAAQPTHPPPRPATISGRSSPRSPERAEEEEKNIESMIESEERWQYDLKILIEESVKQVQKMEKERKYWREMKQSAAKKGRRGESTQE
ncbi:hypothetical protein CEP54_014619 [Fusarium duplospermum]|uniref:Uncharacterized protein n=1 Tax=Fusarium duplospermum TaxID=1325734 RepID=A0A428NUY2_9HYPO|nr:hypothetical protein CEP54_014619 [Fusarium duplospermum]